LLPAIDGIRVAFQDQGQTDLETNYPLMRQYLPLAKVPGEYLILGVTLVQCWVSPTQSDMLVCRSIWVSILRRPYSRTLGNRP
jgi:hypothetical protein